MTGRLRRLFDRIDGPVRASPVGRAAGLSWPRRAAALAVAGLVVGVDLAGLVPFDADLRRLLPALGAAALGLWLFRGDTAAWGLRPAPIQGWAWWLRTGLLLGLGVLVVVGAVGGILLLVGGPVHWPAYRTWGELGDWAVQGCLVAPVVEEAVYRLALCPPLAAVLGPRTAVAVSTVLFAVLHVQYGKPSPDNFAGGLVFAWAYMASGSLVVPMLLHAAGNLAVVLNHAAVGRLW